MIIISKSIIYVFAEKHPDVRDAVDDWYRKVKLANWSNFGEMKNAFNTVDYVGNDRFVFNLKGNRYRIVVMIHFNRRTLYSRFLGTHKEYDKVDCLNI
jgi:mRNA interferase HigB